MGNNDTRRGIKVYLDTTDYTKGMQAIVQKTAEYTHSLEELEAAGEGNSKAADKMRQTITRLQETENKYKNDVTQTKRVLENLSGSTYNQLIGVRKKLDAQLKDSIPGTEKYNAILEQQRRVGLQVAKVDQDRRSALGSQSSAYSRATSSISEYIGKATMLAASIMGVKYTIESSVEAYASMEEAMSKGRKYIGMTKDQVRDLNKSLQQIDTRTSREKLNALAGDAGKLGIAGKEGALEFVDAANQINVALGEDLGEDAVTNIGKLAMMFGEDKTKGLRGAMLATGSAVNAVAQSSSASEPYLVDFLARVGSTAHLMHISQADLIGYASSLDQNMAEVEVAGTTFQNVMVKMFQTPAKFAKMAGMDVKEFTNLIKTDANEAFIQMMQNLNKMGGMDKLAPIFADMNLDGQKAVQILSIFAGNINQVRQEQLNANKAYNEATSITQEYNIQNNTAQAVIEKKKKAIEDETIVLGEKLMPAYVSFLNGQITLLQVFSSAINILISYAKYIGYVISIGAAYVVGLKLQVLWTNLTAKSEGQYIVVLKLKNAWMVVARTAMLLYSAAYGLLTGNISMAVSAMKLFNATIKANPWGLAASLLIAIAGAIYLVVTRTEEMSKATKRSIEDGKMLIDIQESAAKGVAAEKVHIDSLIDSIHNGNLKNKERIAYINELKSIIPSYNAEISNEGKIINENTNSIKNYLVELEKKLKMEAATDMLKGLYATQINQELSKNRRVSALKIREKRIKEYDYSDKSNGSTTPTYPNVGKTYVETEDLKDSKSEAEGWVADINEKLDTTTSKIAYLKSFIKSNEISSKTTKKAPDTPAVPYITTPKQTNEKALWKQKLDVINASYEEQKAATKKFKEDNNLTEEQYNIIALAQESDYQSKRIESLDKSLETEKKASAKVEIRKEIAEANSAMLDAQVKYDDAQVDSSKKCRDEDLQIWEDYYTSTKNEMDVRLAEHNITQQDYDSSLVLLDQTLAEKRLATQQNFLNDIRQLEIKTGKVREKAVKESGDAVTAAAQENSIATAKVYESMYKRIGDISELEVGGKEKDSPSSYQLQLSILDAYYKAAKQKMESNGQDTTNLTEAYAKAKLNIEQKYQEERIGVMDQYGISTVQEQYNMELKALKKAHDKGLLSEKQYQRALKKIRKKGGSDWENDLSDTMSKISSTLGQASDAVSALQEAETAGVEAKYDVEIEAAGDNTEEVTRLENEKAQAKLDIQKKYADVDFAIKTSKIIADTAGAIIETHLSLGGWTPWAIAAAALMGVTGAAEVAVANAERNKVKNMTLSSSSSSSSTASRVTQYASGKYDVMGADDRRSYNGVPYLESASGVITHPALISEQGSELIINATDLKRLQKDVNYPLVLKSIENAHRGTPVTQHASGTVSASSTSDSSRSASSAASNSDYAELLTAVKALTEKMGSPTKAYVTLTDLSAKQELKSRQEKRFTRGDKKNK